MLNNLIAMLAPSEISDITIHMPKTTARLGCKHVKLNMGGINNLLKSLEQL